MFDQRDEHAIETAQRLSNGEFHYSRIEAGDVCPTCDATGWDHTYPIRWGKGLQDFEPEACPTCQGEAIIHRCDMCLESLTLGKPCFWVSAKTLKGETYGYALCARAKKLRFKTSQNKRLKSHCKKGSNF